MSWLTGKKGSKEIARQNEKKEKSIHNKAKKLHAEQSKLAAKLLEGRQQEARAAIKEEREKFRIHMQSQLKEKLNSMHNATPMYFPLLPLHIIQSDAWVSPENPVLLSYGIGGLSVPRLLMLVETRIEDHTNKKEGDVLMAECMLNEPNLEAGEKRWQLNLNKIINTSNGKEIPYVKGGATIKALSLPVKDSELKKAIQEKYDVTENKLLQIREVCQKANIGEEPEWDPTTNTYKEVKGSPGTWPDPSSKRASRCYPFVPPDEKLDVKLVATEGVVAAGVTGLGDPIPSPEHADAYVASMHTPRQTPVDSDDSDDSDYELPDHDGYNRAAALAAARARSGPAGGPAGGPASARR